MTKKDYITIANAIISAFGIYDTVDVKTLIQEMCFYLGRDNKDFDPQKFTLYIDEGLERLEE
jgi:hypothetical protein